MTISSSYVPDTYAGDDSTTVFAIKLKSGSGTLLDDSGIAIADVVKVSLKVDSTGVITEQTLTTHYTVSGSNVTMVTAPASGETLILELNPDFTQASDYIENAALPAETLESDLDERNIEAQYLNDSVSKSLKFDPTVTVSGTTLGTLPDPTSNGDKYLKLNSAADGWEVATLSTTAGLGNIVEDTTPQLGGTLDTNSKAIQLSKGADVASATALTLGTDGNYFDITGTTTITSIASLGVGTVVHLHFDGALQLTHHATDLILPGAANFTTEAGDELTFIEYASGDFRCIGYALADGGTMAAAGGGLSNIVEDTTPQLGGQLDVNGNAIGDGTNELLTFTEDASAVNHVNIENEATGSGPIISAAGDDTNIDLNISAKGTGNVTVGNYSFDADQTVGSGQDNYILTYDNSGGLVALEEAPSIGKHTIFVPASAMRATVSNGAAAINDVETTAGRPDMTAFDFDATADEHVQFQVAFPKSYNLSTVTAQFFWESTAADTDGVTWAIQGVAVSDNATIDVAYGTAVTVDDANQSAAEELLVSAESGAITIAGTPADNDLVFFRVFRDVSDANDTATEDARLLGVKLFYTTDTGDDT